MFTPMTDKELRELWEAHGIGGKSLPTRVENREIRRLILSVVWWMAMEQKRRRIYYHGHLTKADEARCQYCGQDDDNWFRAKLREIGIELEEDENVSR